MSHIRPVALMLALLPVTALAEPDPVATPDPPPPDMQNAVITILQQQRNEAMDRAALLAAQLTLAQRKLRELKATPDTGKRDER